MTEQKRTDNRSAVRELTDDNVVVVMVRAVVPPDIEKRLRDMAAKDGRTLSAMIARILIKAVDKD